MRIYGEFYQAIFVDIHICEYILQEDAGSNTVFDIVAETGSIMGVARNFGCRVKHILK